MSVLRSVIVGGVLVLALSGACLTGLLFYGQALSDAEVAEGRLASPVETRARLAEEQRRFGAMTPAQHVAAARDALALGYDPRAHTGGDLRGANRHLGAVPLDVPEHATAQALRVDVAWRRAARFGGASPAAYERLRHLADVRPSDGDRAPCLRGEAASSPWQVHRATGPVCFGRTFLRHGDPGEYALAVVPAAADAAWRAVTSPTVDHAEYSALCETPCVCLDGGQFTYFQTFFDLPPGRTVSTLTVTVAGVDDGARVTVNHGADSSGDAGSYIPLGGVGATGNLRRFVTPGPNRVVITHLDDCCTDGSLLGVRVVLDGVTLRSCGGPARGG